MNILNKLFNNNRNTICNPFLVPSFFNILMCAALLHLNNEDDLILDKSVYMLCGIILFIINSGYFLKNYRFAITTVFIILIYNFSFITILFSILGYVLFLIVLISSKKKFTAFFWGFLFSFALGNNIICNYQTDFLYKFSLSNYYDGTDNVFHAVVASNLKNKGICTTSLHDYPEFKYWDLSNSFVAKFSKYLNIRSFDFYNIHFPIFIWSLILYFSLSFIQILKIQRFPKQFDRNNIVLYSLLLLALSFLSLSPYFGPVHNFLKWESQKVLSVSFSLSLVLLLILCTRDFFIKENNNYSQILIFFILFFFSIIICKTKLYIIHFLIISVFVSLFFKFEKKIENLKLPSLLLIIITYIYYHFQFSSIGTGFTLSIFELWSIFSNQTIWLWSPFILGLPLILVIAYLPFPLEFNSFRIKLKCDKRYFLITSLIVLFLFCYFTSLFIGGKNSIGILYYIDTFYLILTIPLCFNIFIYLNKHKNQYPIHKIITLSFLFILSLQTVFTSAKRWIEIFHDSYNIKDLIFYDDFNNEQINTIKICNTLKKISKLGYTNSVLWVPRSNKNAWNAFNLRSEFTRPFIFSALSELPLLFGFPSTDENKLKDIGFGFHAYESFKFNLDSKLAFAKSEAKRLGYNFLIVLDSPTEFSQFSL